MFIISVFGGILLEALRVLCLGYESVRIDDLEFEKCKVEVGVVEGMMEGEIVHSDFQVNGVVDLTVTLKSLVSASSSPSKITSFLSFRANTDCFL